MFQEREGDLKKKNVMHIVYALFFAPTAAIILFTGAPKWVLAPLGLFGLLAYWLIFIKSKDGNHIEVGDSEIRVGTKGKGHEYRDLTYVSMDLDATRRGSTRDRNSHVSNTSANLHLTFNDGRTSKSLIHMRGRDSMWTFIEGCRAYNNTAEVEIKISRVIPETFDEFDRMLDKWHRQDPIFVKELRQLRIEDYAESEGISLEEAEKTVYGIYDKVEKVGAVLAIVQNVMRYMPKK